MKSIPTTVELAIPFGFDGSGTTAFITSKSRATFQHIETIILTLLGERVMLPSYGTNVKASVFGSNSAAFSGGLVQQIQNAVAIWEPTISLTNVVVLPSPNEPNVVAIQITYAETLGAAPTTITLQTNGIFSGEIST